MKQKYRALSKNIFLFSVASFGHKILAFFLVPFYTGFLTTRQYGVIDLVMNTIMVLIPILTINISQSVMRFTLSDKSNKGYLKIGFRMVCIGNVTLLICIALANFFPLFSKYKEYFIWIFLIFMFNSIFSLTQDYLRAIDKVNVMVAGGLTNSFVMLLSSVIFIAVFKLEVRGYFVSQILGFTSGLLIMVPFMINASRKSNYQKIPKEQRKEMLNYCIPTIFTTLAWWINTSLDHYLVTGICGLEKNGIYSVSYKIPQIVGAFQGIFVSAWTLSAIKEFDKEDRDGFFGNTFSTYNSFMTILCSAVMLANYFLSSILFSKDFFEAWKYVPLLLTATLFSALSGYLGSIFAAVKDTRTCAISTIVSAIINVGLNMILIPRFEIWGAAIATVIAYIIAYLIRIIVSRKFIVMKVNYIRILFMYLLICTQLILSSGDNRFYFAQIFILISIILLSRRDISRVILSIKKNSHSN